MVGRMKSTRKKLSQRKRARLKLFQVKLSRRSWLGALGASGVSAVCGSPPGDGAEGDTQGRDDPCITYTSCEGHDGPLRVEADVVGGGLLAREEFRIDLARGVLTRGPLSSDDPGLQNPASETG